MNSYIRQRFLIQLRAGVLTLGLLILSATSACLPSPDCYQTDTSCNSVALTGLLAAVAATTAVPGVATWMIVGDNGTILSSPTGTSDWTNVSPAGVTNLRDVVYGAAGFVAVGVNGRIVTSPTGAAGTWTERTSGTVDTLFAVDYDPNNNIYAAVGGQNGTSDLILTSSDGVTWTDRTLALPNRFSKLTYTGTQFVAVGRGGVTADSNDGITWNGGTSGAFDWSAVAFGGGVLLAENGGTQLHTAADRSGLPNFTGSHTAANLESAIYYAAGPFFILGGDTGSIFTSPNGVGAAVVRSTAPVDIVWDFATDGQRVITAGGTGEVAVSEDGLNWTLSTISGSNLRGATFALVPGG